MADPILEVAAEDLWEEIGGGLCICQRQDVSHWCENCQRTLQKIREAMAAWAALVGFDADELREAWEAGFVLCRSYGDNWIHFDGEQKDLHWQKFLEKAALSGDAAADDICYCRKNPCICLKHDAACESEQTSHGYTPCRCAERSGDAAPTTKD